MAESGHSGRSDRASGSESGADSGEIFTLDPEKGDRNVVLEVDGVPGGFDVFVDDDGERRLSYHTETGGMHLIAVSGFLDD